MAKRQARNTAWTNFSKYIRLRDCIETTGTKTHGICCTCSRRYPISETHAGHFIAGRHDAVLFDEESVHLQCVSCNTFQGGRPSQYGAFMTRKYGEGIIERKYQESWKIVKYTEEDYRGISKEYLRKYKNLNSLSE
jgi:hypothetical protein